MFANKIINKKISILFIQREINRGELKPLSFLLLKNMSAFANFEKS